MIDVLQKSQGVLRVVLEILKKELSLFDGLVIWLRHKFKSFVELCLHFYNSKVRFENCIKGWLDSANSPIIPLLYNFNYKAVLILIMIADH